MSEEDYEVIHQNFIKKGTLDITLPDLGFCIKHELTGEDKERMEEIIEWKEENIWSKKRELDEDEVYGAVGIVTQSLPMDMALDQRRLDKIIYKDFKFAAPGYFEETMEFARSHDQELKVHIPKGARIYYDYPMSCVVVGEITEELTRSSQFIEAFCEGYQEIYRLEEESSKKEAMPLCEENPECSLINRNRTDGCFGIWGHDIGDLVLEDIHFYDGGKHITLVIGS